MPEISLDSPVISQGVLVQSQRDSQHSGGGQDQAAQPVVWFFFGLSGVGKSWVADNLARYYGWPVYHADTDLTAEMQQALAESRPFTPAMRGRYFERLAKLLKKRLSDAGGHQNILVSQGAYKKSHREYLAAQIPNFRAVWVDSPVSLWERRIENRQEGISLSSARALQGDFEPPEEGADRLLNNADFAHVLAQFQALWHHHAAMAGTGPDS